MSFETDVLDFGDDLLAYWPIRNISGTTIADARGGSFLPLTVTDPAAGPALTNMGGTSLRGNGTSTRASTVNLPNGHALRLPDGAPFSMFCWYSCPSAPSTARAVMGRNGQQVMRVSNIGIPNPLAGGVNISGVTFVPNNGAAFYVVDWDGKELRFYVNGELEASQPGIPVGGSSADPFEVLSQSAGLIAPGDVSDIGVIARPIGRGGAKQLYFAGAITPYVAAPGLYDHQSPRVEVINSPESTRCFLCGGLRHTNQSGISRGPEIYDAACYGGRARSVTTVVPNITSPPAMTATEIGARVAATIHDMLSVQAGRANTSKPWYFNGQTWVVDFQTTDAPCWVGAGSGAAMLQKLSGSDEDTWLRRIAMASAEQFMATQTMSGSHEGTYGGGPSTSLGSHYLFETYLWLQDSLGRGTRERWLASFMRNAEYWRRSESWFYTNGNIEAGQLLNKLLLAIITDDDSWMDEYEYQLDFMANPPTVRPGGGNNNNSTGDNQGKFGWYTVNGTTATKGLPAGYTGDGSNLEGFFAEGKNDPVNFPGWAPGYDPYYTQVQIAFMMRVHQWSFLKFPAGDPRVLRYVNALWNLLIKKVNTSGVAANGIGPWQIDARTGLDGVAPASRNPTFIRQFSNAVGFYLVSNPQFRATNPIPATWPAQQWATNEKEQRDNRGAMGTFMRGLGEILGPWLTASPLWTPQHKIV